LPKKDRHSRERIVRQKEDGSFARRLRWFTLSGMPRPRIWPPVSEAVHLTESQFIKERCLHMIRQSSMVDKPWRWTLLDQRHKLVAEQTTLHDDEYPIVSICFGADNWTLLTTHRMISMMSAHRSELDAARFGEASYGNFKGDLNDPMMVSATVSPKPSFLGRARGPVSFVYESGYASMPPIDYFKFWAVKWPAWKKAYECAIRSASS
jgi:hypothetical protein